jgi:pSer/pThr/pTyr-binding forkhead associated (FHA) protein
MSAEKEGKPEKSKAALELPEWATDAREGTYLQMCHPDAPGSSNAIPIDKAKSYLIGRHEGEFKVMVDHVTVSRRHALLVHRGDIVLLYDMSSNGSSINGTPVPKKEYVELAVGDILRFGDHPSTFTLAFEASNSTGQAARSDAASMPARRRASGSPHSGDVGSTTAQSTKSPPLGNPLTVYGLKLHIGSKGLEVRTVEPDSVAELHSFPFSWGDVIISIDDKDTSSMSKAEVTDALAQGRSGEQVRLGVKKGGELRQVTLAAAGKLRPKVASEPGNLDAAAEWSVRLASMLDGAIQKEKPYAGKQGGGGAGAGGGGKDRRDGVEQAGSVPAPCAGANAHAASASGGGNAESGSAQIAVHAQASFTSSSSANTGAHPPQRERGRPRHGHTHSQHQHSSSLSSSASTSTQVTFLF